MDNHAITFVSDEATLLEFNLSKLTYTECVALSESAKDEIRALRMHLAQLLARVEFIATI